MTYQVLARKWRPRDFPSLVGQEHVQRALINALDNDRVHHAFLFTGTRGVGKTTIARILAKSLNCETGVSSSPCGKCSSCMEIDDGRFVDLIEVDAASRTKVEDTRELLDNVQYAPTRGRYKVYLIDEVHMLSNHSFNALLKTLEEPPPHVKFLLATTDPQKLPVTILSRCLQFNLRRLAPDQIREHLVYILNQENLEFEPAALPLLARAADGSMRDALSLLDQAIAFGGGKVGGEDVRAMLGCIENRHVYAILDALARHDPVGLMQQAEQLAESSPDYFGVFAELTSQLHQLALMQQVPGYTDPAMGDKQELSRLAGILSAEDIQLYYQIALTGRRDLPLAPDPQSGFEMALLRMLAFSPDAQMDAPTAAPTPTPKATPSTDDVPRASTSNSVPSASPVTSRTEPAKTSNPSPVGTSQQPDESALTQSETNEQWHQLLSRLNLGGVVNQLAMNCVLSEINDDEFCFVLDVSKEPLLTKDRQMRLKEQISADKGREVKLKIEVAPTTLESPAARETRLQAERQAEAEQAIAEDNGVKAIMDAFNAEVKPGSVQPVD